MVAQDVKSTTGRHRKMLFINRSVKVKTFFGCRPKIECIKKNKFTRAAFFDNPSGTSGIWGCVPAVDSRRRTIFVADAHRGDGKRYLVRADEKLTAFMELESGIWVQRIVSTSWPDFFQTPDHAPGSSAAACC
jgi:hypothetical protein